LSLRFLTEKYAVRAYWGNGNIAPLILDFGTRWRWAVSFAPRPLYLQLKLLVVTHWVGEWMGPRVGMDTLVKRKIPSPCTY